MMANSENLSASGRPLAHTARLTWSRWLKHVLGLARELWHRRSRGSADRQEPVFRIAQMPDESWVVERPGAAIEHAFADLDGAAAFVRNESATPAIVELRIGDLYVVARFDPGQPGSLFGETVT